MTGPDGQNPAIYRVLKDILERQAEIVSVRFEPDSIQRQYLAAEVDPNRVDPPTGPDTPSIEVHWKTTPPHDEFRIDYHDPNTGFHCGWHQDDDHDDLGRAHFQYRTDKMEEPEYEGTRFEARSPARILWECCDRLFEDILGDLTRDEGRN